MKIDRANAGELLAVLFDRYHRPEYIHPDPLELVLKGAPCDREVTGLIASALALGRVDLILSAVARIIATLQAPTEALKNLSRKELGLLFRGFRYRFFSGSQLANFLFGVGETLRRWGSLEALFRSGIRATDNNTVPALARFVDEVRALSGGDIGILLSDPDKGSASKRLHLFLRWMVRRDQIDPGGWEVPTRLLVVPADVHMLRVSRLLGFTARRQPDLRAAIEITAALSEYCPDDPVKFDFSMTRLGIHPDLSYDHLNGPDPNP